MMRVLVTGVVGVVLLWVALRGWRQGRLTMPGGDDARVLLRGETLFRIALGLLVLTGGAMLALAGVTGREEMDPSSGALVAYDGDGYRIGVPERWEPAPELIDERMQARGFGGVAFARRDEQLMLMSPPAAPLGKRAAAVGTVLDGFVKTVSDPAIRYQHWEVERAERHIDIRMRYRAPRGQVVGHIIAAVDRQRRLRTFHALCSHERDATTCQQIVDSLELTLPAAELLPLSTSTP